MAALSLHSIWQGDDCPGLSGDRGGHNWANEIHPVMKRIAVLAEQFRCAIVLIGHMNKCNGGKFSYRGLGSIDFQAAARSVLVVGRVKEDEDIRVACHVKSSLAPEGTQIAFRMDELIIGLPDLAEDECIKILIHGEQETNQECKIDNAF